MKTPLVLALTTVIAFAASRPAAADAPQAFDEHALVTYALTHSPQLRAERAEKPVAEAQVTIASALENPVLRLEWLHAQTGSAAEMGWGVGLAWNPPQPTVYSARKGAARAHTRAVAADVAEREADVAAAVREGCATAQVLAELAAILERTVATRRRLEQVIVQRVQLGASTRIDLGLASLSAVKAEQELDLARMDRARVLDQLAALAGLPAGAAIEVSAPTDAADAPPPDPGVAEQQGLQSRPIVRADEARGEERDEAVRGERARRWPWFGFSSLPRYRERDASGYPHDLSFAIDVTLPILDGNHGRIAAAEAEREHQVALAAAHVAEIRRDVRLAQAEAARRRELLEKYRATVAPLLREHATLLEQALNQRQLDLTAILAAEDMVLRSQRDFAEARLAYRRARVRLARAMGENR
jgi:outer membrane protein TolC